MISNETREKWKDKVHAINRAYECGVLDLDDYDLSFMETVYNLTENNKDLTFKQSKHLNRIYERM